MPTRRRDEAGDRGAIGPENRVWAGLGPVWARVRAARVDGRGGERGWPGRCMCTGGERVAVGHAALAIVSEAATSSTSPPACSPTVVQMKVRSCGSQVGRTWAHMTWATRPSLLLASCTAPLT